MTDSSHKFMRGDVVVDEEGDVGVIIIPKPDVYGFVVWVCTERVTKYAVYGAYYESKEHQLNLYEPSESNRVLNYSDGGNTNL
jgi:hypothetical protein